MRYCYLPMLLSCIFSTQYLAAADIVLPSGVTLNPGQQATFTVTLAQPAPSGGVFVSLSSSAPSQVLISVAAVLVNQGLTTSRPIQMTGLKTGTASISAAAFGLTGDTQVVTVLDPTASQGVITLPPPITVATKQAAAFPIAVSPAAPAGGVTITLTNSDSTRASISSQSIFIAAGSTTPSIQPQLTGLAVGSTTIGASAAGYMAASQTVGVVAGASSSALSFSPASLAIGPGQTNSMQLNLSTAAPAGGRTVSLVSGNTAAVTVPPSVTIAANTTSASVAVTAVGAGSATITATANAANITGTSATVTVNSVRDLNLPAGITVGPGQQANFPVTLAQPAPSGGVFVSFASSDTSKLTISPANGFIAQGQTSLVRPPQITGVAAGAATVSAVAYGLTGDSQVVLVGTGQQLLPGSLTVTGIGTTQYLSLTLSSAAGAGGVTFTLSSSNPAVATVPGSVTLAAGALSVVVPVASVAAGTTTINSRSLPSYGDATANVTVVNTGVIGLSAGLSLSLGQAVPFPVTLGAPAAAGGLAVSLTNSDPAKVSLSSASVFIAAGSTAPATQVQITGLASGASVIGASAPGYAPSSQIVQVQAAQGGGTLSFSPTTLTLAGAAGSLQLNLSTRAPAGGLSINLASSNTPAVTVPANVIMGGNNTAVTVPVTAAGPGSATITASTAAGNVTGTSATVVVSSGQSIILPSGLNVTRGDQVNFPVTLAQPAPAGGVFVSLTSSDPSKVSIFPGSVLIGVGETTLTRPPQLTALAEGSVTISASAYGFTGASTLVRIGGAPGFSPTSLNITGFGATQTLTLTIPALAPAGGLTVTLSSDNRGVATLPATVVFPAGTSSLEVPITSVGAGGTAIHAVALPVLGDSVAYVTVSTTDLSVTWQGACWYNGTLKGVTGSYHAIDFTLTTSTPVPLQGSLFFTNSCDLSKGYDNMNDYNALTGSGRMVQGFSNNPDIIPSSALYWVGPRTVDGSCPKGVPCSGCLVYTKATPDCNSLP